jgi:hypothetical protein
MPSYDKAPPEVSELVAEIIEQHYQDLKQAEVSIECLQAKAPIKKKTGLPNGPALKLHGWPCAAIVSINNEKKRAEGVADATITIDWDRWPEWNEDQRRALIDHEIHHLVIARDKFGGIKEDSLGRPKLKMRPHDWETSGFKVIAERHGEASFEVTEAKNLKMRFGQLLWGWGDEDRDPRSGRNGPSSRKPRLANVEADPDGSQIGVA